LQSASSQNQDFKPSRIVLGQVPADSPGLQLLGSQASEPCSPSTCNFTSSLKKLLQRAHHLTWIKALTQQQLSVLPGSASFSLSQLHVLHVLCIQSWFQFHIHFLSK
ncbi:hypothetical protein ILYODFUR_038154, partial [Ilyodon furcidens]